ncbi:hypothetical protein CDAR_559251 [Caerostris darwini]|uniref:Uncharacterized protein n=1 Tax=Caerostris darwini TaxID=1538125 RepID=A0AAV4P0T3_9ARAC|nr:hypothetical protein CDAR_559251 [Caerostris darwini]
MHTFGLGKEHPSCSKSRLKSEFAGRLLSFAQHKQEVENPLHSHVNSALSRDVRRKECPQRQPNGHAIHRSQRGFFVAFSSKEKSNCISKEFFDRSKKV